MPGTSPTFTAASSYEDMEGLCLTSKTVGQGVSADTFEPSWEDKDVIKKSSSSSSLKWMTNEIITDNGPSLEGLDLKSTQVGPVKTTTTTSPSLVSIVPQQTTPKPTPPMSPVNQNSRQHNPLHVTPQTIPHSVGCCQNHPQLLIQTPQPGLIAYQTNPVLSPQQYYPQQFVNLTNQSPRPDLIPYQTSPIASPQQYYPQQSTNNVTNQSPQPALMPYQTNPVLSPQQYYPQQSTNNVTNQSPQPGLIPYQTNPIASPQQYYPQQSTSNVLLSNFLKMDLPTFSGNGGSLSPEEFIADCQRFCRFYAIDEHTRLRRILPCALVEDAHQWLSDHQTFNTWGEFVKAFHAEYSPPDYYFRLSRELDDRTQHPEEPLGRYIRTIVAYYDRIGDPRVTEEEKVRRVRCQMHPEYRRLIQGRSFATLREMSAAAPALQQEAWQMNSYRPPPTGDNLIAKDLAYWGDRDDNDNKDLTLKPTAMYPSKVSFNNNVARIRPKKKNKPKPVANV